MFKMIISVQFINILEFTNRYQITAHQEQILRPITLPHSKARPNIVTFDAKNLIIELLTDPRIVDEDYLFRQ